MPPKTRDKVLQVLDTKIATAVVAAIIGIVPVTLTYALKQTKAEAQQELKTTALEGWRKEHSTDHSRMAELLNETAKSLESVQTSQRYMLDMINELKAEVRALRTGASSSSSRRSTNDPS